jgi:two-component system alkaline phosphatase synthesis response regulator PhoP
LGESRAIDAHICRLRTKFKEAGIDPNLIRTIRYRGYKIADSCVSDEKH